AYAGSGPPRRRGDLASPGHHPRLAVLAQPGHPAHGTDAAATRCAVDRDPASRGHWTGGLPRPADAAGATPKGWLYDGFGREVAPPRRPVAERLFRRAHVAAGRRHRLQESPAGAREVAEDEDPPRIHARDLCRRCCGLPAQRPSEEGAVPALARLHRSSHSYGAEPTAHRGPLRGKIRRRLEAARLHRAGGGRLAPLQRHYNEAVSSLDEQIGRVLEALEEA